VPSTPGGPQRARILKKIKSKFLAKKSRNLKEHFDNLRGQGLLGAIPIPFLDWDIKLVSQIFVGVQKCGYVGVITSFRLKRIMR
jgi:hypothetical protein